MRRSMAAMYHTLDRAGLSIGMPESLCVAEAHGRAGRGLGDVRPGRRGRRRRSPGIRRWSDGRPASRPAGRRGHLDRAFDQPLARQLVGDRAPAQRARERRTPTRLTVADDRPLARRQLRRRVGVEPVGARAGPHRGRSGARRARGATSTTTGVAGSSPTAAASPAAIAAARARQRVVAARAEDRRDRRTRRARPGTATCARRRRVDVQPLARRQRAAAPVGGSSRRRPAPIASHDETAGGLEHRGAPRRCRPAG